MLRIETVAEVKGFSHPLLILIAHFQGYGVEREGQKESHHHLVGSDDRVRGAAKRLFKPNSLLPTPLHPRLVLLAVL